MISVDAARQSNEQAMQSSVTEKPASVRDEETNLGDVFLPTNFGIAVRQQVLMASNYFHVLIIVMIS